VQTVVELTLKRPLKLGMVEIPRVEFKIIGMYGNRRIFKLYENFDAFAFSPCREIEQRMFVELQLRKNPFESRVRRIRHTTILSVVLKMRVERSSTGESVDIRPFIYSYRSASMGSSLAALMAGNMPLTIPTKLNMPVDHIRVAASIVRWISPSSAPS